MLEERSYFVYIISNYRRTTFYIGVTNDLYCRIEQHRKAEKKSFSRRYQLKYLVYYEETNDIGAAIAREKQLKNWHRDWKLNLIRSVNPMLEDLSKKWG